MKLIYTIIKILILLVFLLLAITNTHTVSFFYLPGQKHQSAADCRAFRCLYYRHRVRYVCPLRPSVDLRSENNRLRAEVKKYAHLSEKDLTPVKTETPATASETAPKA